MRRYGAVFFQKLAGGVFEKAEDPPLSPLAIKIAGAFSPWVEAVEADLVLMDLGGLTRQWPEEKQLAVAIRQKFEEQDLRAQVAIASNRITARLLARGCVDSAVVPPGQEKQFLAPLPLELLEPPEELRQVFERWGLQTLEDLARLPKNSLAQRLGEKGMELYFQACGQDGAPLTPCIPTEIFEASFVFDWPLDNSEPLAFTMNHLLERLCTQLASVCLATEGVTLSLELANRASDTRLLRFGYPLRDPSTILSLLRMNLETHPPEAAIISLGIRLCTTPLRPIQFSLIDPPLPAPEKLARTLARLAALVGEQNVGSPALLDTHRPDAFLMQSFQPSAGRTSQVTGRRSKVPSFECEVSHGCTNLKRGARDREPETQSSERATSDLRPVTCDARPAYMALRRFRPPLPARVVTRQRQPVAVKTAAIEGQVLKCGGPWRSSGEWWENGQRWARDEWDVLLSNGGLYRLCRDLLQKESWFVDGIYD